MRLWIQIWIANTYKFMKRAILSHRAKEPLKSDVNEFHVIFCYCYYYLARTRFSSKHYDDLWLCDMCVRACVRAYICYTFVRIAKYTIVPELMYFAIDMCAVFIDTKINIFLLSSATPNIETESQIHFFHSFLSIWRRMDYLRVCIMYTRCSHKCSQHQISQPPHSIVSMCVCVQALIFQFSFHVTIAFFEIT